jgi:hypothetical protein
VREGKLLLPGSQGEACPDRSPRLVIAKGEHGSDSTEGGRART